MRERIAMGVSALAVAVLITLSALFARAQNQPAPAADVAAAAVPDSIRGKAVFDAQGCVRCHSVAGVGNTRTPLDGVGARRSAAELRAWTVGAPELADSLAPATFRAKQAYREMPSADLDALIRYLGTLGEGG